MLELWDSGYRIGARFENVGGLKVRSPVTMGGVRVGRVTAVDYDGNASFACRAGKRRLHLRKARVQNEERGFIESFVEVDFFSMN